METFAKYVWLLEKIKQEKTLEEISFLWEEKTGKPLPKRTFHKWKDAIEEIFDIKIENENSGEYRYKIATDFERDTTKSWLIDTLSTSNLLLDCKNLKNRILLENIPSGKEFLQPIISAMQQNRTIEVTYYNFWTDTTWKNSAAPLCVKLFNRRWYVLAKIGDNTRVLSLDRIQNLEILDEKFEFPANFSPEEFFSECFGVIVGDNSKPEKIVLKFSAKQANFIRRLPLHATQRETERNDEFSIFEFFLRPTFDFKQEILRHGANVEVLQPLSLREEIANIAQNMLNLYKN